MKRITIYVAFLAAVSLLGSCKDMKDLSEPSSADQVKTVQVDLGSVTRAVSESAVNDATLFVYQHNAKTGESLLYHQVYGTGSTFELDLLFSDQTTYTYDIKAYANMGELASEGGDVLFSGESESGLQLHGQVLGIGEADASAVTVDMSRYVGKVTVSKVAVDWTNDHGLQELKLVSMYLANVPAKVGGEAEYNVGGTYVPSAMDAFLYKPVDSVIGDGEAYTTAQSMYGYAGDAAIVLECELSGEKMYYHVPYSPEANTHRAFSFTIRQNGAQEPLGSLPEEALEVSVVTLNVLGYDASEEEVNFGPMNVNNYLTIVALDDGLTASLSFNDVEYCVDGDEDWKVLSAGTETEPINAGQTLSFRGELIPNESMGIGTFYISKKCNLKGNCMSMLFGDNAVYVNSLEGVDFAFINLFADNTNIINVSPDFLPATTLADNCYVGMFYTCVSLTTAPELPATTLAGGCYSHMFSCCTSLTTAPELPATTLAEACYASMFGGCTNLTTAPELPATRLADNCYESMFWYCTSLNHIKMLATDVSSSDCLNNWVYAVGSEGTFVKNPAMTSLPTASSSNDYVGIPVGWTVIDNNQ